MSDETNDSRERYHAALSNLFDQVTRDPAFNSNPALRDSAIAAQSALGKVEERADFLRSANGSDAKSVLSRELRTAENELDTAAVHFLQNSVEGNGETVDAARELYESLPADVSKSSDLGHVKAVIDQRLLKLRKP